MSTQPNTGLARKRATMRRGIIAGLVVVCLVLFSAYVRESNDGALHGAQDAAARAVSPVQSVASDAVSPLRDAWGWMADLRDARSRAEALEEENGRLLAESIERRSQAAEVQRLRGLAGVGAGLDADYDRVTGEVIARSITNTYKASRLDVGSERGIVVNSPVLALGSDGRSPVGALVGVVSQVRPGSADVRFLTDGRTEVGAIVQEANSAPGILTATAPGLLQLSGIPRQFAVRSGQTVVTGGFSGLNLPSLYPPDIPIGQVTGVSRAEVNVQYTVQVTPFVDPRSLRYMVVLAPTSDRAKRRATG
ncbi:MAG: rod shape-determining protein MreC [Miltoncostaeaceae bacterium]